MERQLSNPDLIEAELAAEDEEKLRLELELEASKEEARIAAEEMQAEIEAELEAFEAELEEANSIEEVAPEDGGAIVDPETTIDENLVNSGVDNEANKDLTVKPTAWYFSN